MDWEDIIDRLNEIIDESKCSRYDSYYFEAIHETFNRLEGFQKIEDFLLIETERLGKTRNVVEKGMLQAYKNVLNILELYMK